MNARHYRMLSTRALDRANEWSARGDLLVSLIWWRLHTQWELLADETHNRNTEALIRSINEMAEAATLDKRMRRINVALGISAPRRWVDGPDSPGVLP